MGSQLPGHQLCNILYCNGYLTESAFVIAVFMQKLLSHPERVRRIDVLAVRSFEDPDADSCCRRRGVERDYALVPAAPDMCLTRESLALPETVNQVIELCTSAIPAP
jgi:hypothetical protein